MPWRAHSYSSWCTASESSESNMASKQPLMLDALECMYIQHKKHTMDVQNIRRAQINTLTKFLNVGTHTCFSFYRASCLRLWALRATSPLPPPLLVRIYKVQEQEKVEEENQQPVDSRYIHSHVQCLYMRIYVIRMSVALRWLFFHTHTRTYTRTYHASTAQLLFSPNSTVQKSNFI